MCKRFLSAIKRNLGEALVSPGAAAICETCLDTYDVPDRDARGRFWGVDGKQSYLDEHDEPSFSWRACDACGCGLGGDRHAAHDLHKADDGEESWEHIEICSDCLVYFANGDLPDEWCV